MFVCFYLLLLTPGFFAAWLRFLDFLYLVSTVRATSFSCVGETVFIFVLRDILISRRKFDIINV